MSCKSDTECSGFESCMKDTGICVPNPCSPGFLGSTCQEKDKSKYCSTAQGACLPRIAADQPCQGNPLTLENVCQDGLTCSSSMGLGKCVASGGANGGNSGGGGGGGGLTQPSRIPGGFNPPLGVPTDRVGDGGSSPGGTLSPAGTSSGVSTVALIGSILGALAVGVLLAVMLRRRRRFHAPRSPVSSNLTPPAATASNIAAPPPPPYPSALPRPLPDKPSTVEYVTLAPFPPTPSHSSLPNLHGSPAPQVPTTNSQHTAASSHVPSVPPAQNSPWNSSGSIPSLQRPRSTVEVQLGPGDAELALPSTPSRPVVSGEDDNDDLLLPTGNMAKGNLVPPDQRL